MLAATPGYVHTTATPTIEDIADNWDAINDDKGYVTPVDLMSWSETFLAHLPGGESPDPNHRG